MGFWVAHDIVVNQFRVYHGRVYADNVVSKIGLWSPFPLNITQNSSPKLLSETCFGSVKKCITISFICKPSLKFLRSQRHFNCNTALYVIVPYLNESVHIINIICNGRVKTLFHIVEIWRLSKFHVKNMNFPFSIFWYIDGWDFSRIATSPGPSLFSCSGEKFVKELSVLSANSCADAFETKSILNDSIVKWLFLLFLMKVTTDNLVLFVLYCVC